MQEGKKRFPELGLVIANITQTERKKAEGTRAVSSADGWAEKRMKCSRYGVWKRIGPARGVF